MSKFIVNKTVRFLDFSLLVLLFLFIVRSIYTPKVTIIRIVGLFKTPP